MDLQIPSGSVGVKMTNFVVKGRELLRGGALVPMLGMMAIERARKRLARKDPDPRSPDPEAPRLVQLS